MIFIFSSFESKNSFSFISLIWIFLGNWSITLVNLKYELIFSTTTFVIGLNSNELSGIVIFLRLTLLSVDLTAKVELSVSTLMLIFFESEGRIIMKLLFFIKNVISYSIINSYNKK